MPRKQQQRPGRSSAHGHVCSSLPRLCVLLRFGGIDLTNMLTLTLAESAFFSLKRAPVDL